MRRLFLFCLAAALAVYVAWQLSALDFSAWEPAGFFS